MMSATDQLLVRRMLGRLTVDCTHDESDLCCVSGTGEVRVDLLGLCLVERDEAVEDVVASCGIIRATCAILAYVQGDKSTLRTLVIWEIVLHGADRQLLLEPINFV
jgi:hypothetical protein